MTTTEQPQSTPCNGHRTVGYAVQIVGGMTCRNCGGPPSDHA